MAVPLAAALAAASGLVSGCAGMGSKSTQELRAHADEAFVREEYKRAIAFDTEILRRSPDDYTATLQRGVCYERIGSVADAQQDYTRAVDLDQQAGLPRLYRANLALKTGQVEAASADVQALSGMDLPKHERLAALVTEGTYAQARGDYTGALRSYKTAVDMGRGDPDPAIAQHYRDALNNAAECYYRLGIFDRAADLYAELIQAKDRASEPVTEDDHYTFGVLSYLRGDFARARAQFANVSPERRKKAAEVLNDEGFFASTR
jgi:tetratricopeptide (TPR) repeat protein